MDLATESSTSSTSMHDPLFGVSTPMAICGMAMRLPGGISNDSEFWQFLLSKQDARSRVPGTRFDVSGYYSTSGGMTTKMAHGYFLDESVDLSTLDTSFFSFTKYELQYIDPQQRVLLEVVRECFDSAGESDYRGKDVGCFVGSFGDDWTENLIHDEQTADRHPLMAGGDFAIPNRVSYEYDLHGPSVSIRTACSSALVALHQACLSIERGECSAAIIAGCNLLVTPTMTAILSSKGVLSPDGSCKSFDESADGYARGEAISAIYIKPLKDALRGGNPIRAVIRGTAVNSDGKSAGLTVPSAEAQEDVIRKAYHAAGIRDLSQTGFVECHGTGTSVGDPIEVMAIANTFGDKGMYIGSVKPNIGHSEGASGISSVIKAVLALENRTIPPNIKFNTPNPKIPFEAKRIKVPVEATAWPKDRCVRAGVNSFGMGGVNSHVVLESAENFIPPSSPLVEDNGPVPRLLVFSANTQDSLDVMIQQTHAYVKKNSWSLRDLAYTMGARREQLPFRAASVVHSDMSISTNSFGKVPSSASEIVMVFAGQGSQWPGMGFALCQCNDTFRKSLLEMDRVLQSLPDPPVWSIIDEISKENEETNLYLSSHSQPICTALQIALVDALFELNIKPYAVVGHSSGELAAAYAAGKLTASQAVISAFYRGVVAGKVTRAGCMAAIGMGENETHQFLRPGVVIACENSPASVTISGDVDEVEHVMQEISTSRPEVLVRRLKSDTAYHSHHMKAVGDTYHSFIGPSFSDCQESKCNTAYFFSTLKGDVFGDGDIVDAKYWQLNLESPVMFHTAVKNIITRNNNRRLLFLEVSPHSTLAGPIRQTLDQAKLSAPYISCLTRFSNCSSSFLSALGQLYGEKQPIDFNVLTNPNRTAKVLTDVPTYPWQHSFSHIYETRQIREWRSRKQIKHELLGLRVVDSTENSPSWRNLLYVEHVSWLRDHKISGNVVFPAAGYIMMAGEAVQQVGLATSGFHVRSMVLDAAMVLDESGPTEIVTSLRRDSLGKWYTFAISSHNGFKWIEHCTGKVARGHNLSSSENKHEQDLPRSIHVPGWYKTLSCGGLDYGPAFQGMKSLSCSTTNNIASAKVVSLVNDSTSYPIHPTQLDACIQSVYCAVYQGRDWEIEALPIPTSFAEIDIDNCASDLQFTSWADLSTKGITRAAGEAFTSDGALVLKIREAVFRPVGANQSVFAEDDAPAGARLHWRPSIQFINLTDLINSPQNWEDYTMLLNSLTLLCIEEALRRLDAQAISSDIPHLQKYQDWLRTQPKPTSDQKIESLVEQALAALAAPCSRALMKVLDNIVPICKGEIKALEVLMSEGTLFEVYNYLNEIDRAPLFRSLGHYQPQQRILEIGAGTGGTTAKILPQTTYSTYTFTDVSAAFFPAAKDRFKCYPNMSFQTLDITKDPLDQGFEPESFDLIIAANVLHATSSLQETLTNVRKLLHPQGKLLLEELCGEPKYINFIAGLLPGWWEGESDGRSNEPYIPPHQWEKVLKITGFNGLDDVAFDSAPPFHTLAFMLASPSLSRPPLTRRVTLLSDIASSENAIQIQKQLLARGYTVSIQELDEPLLDGGDVISLVDTASPFFSNLNSHRLSSFQSFLRELQRSHSGALWVTRSSQMGCDDPRFSPAIGVARTVRSEFGIDFATCEVDVLKYTHIGLVIDVFEKFIGRLHGQNAYHEYEYVIRDNTIHVGRLFPFSVQEELRRAQEEDLHTQSCRLSLDINTPGSLDSLMWTVVPGERSELLKDDEIEVKIDTAGVSFKDVLVSLGVDERSNTALGLEAAGVVVRVGAQVRDLYPDDRVLTLGPGMFSTSRILPASRCIKIPDCLSLEDAATMPVVFSTAIHTLCDVGRLKNSQSVLIHSACGGVGLAAIQISQMLGATIYATVGNDEKADYLMASYGIPRDRIFSSHDTSFLQGIMASTKGRGVDLVLNSLSGDLLQASGQCVATFGKLINLTKRNIDGHEQPPMDISNRNVTYIATDIIDYIVCRPDEGNRLLREMLELYTKGHIRPITPIKTFSANDVKQCFSYMQSGEHIGKLRISLNSQYTSIEAVCHPKTLTFKSDSSYLLVGGLGGLGSGISRWMVDHGARHLIFLSRTADAESHYVLFRELESQGCSITAVKGSVCNPSDVKKAISCTTNLKGIFNISMVLQDLSLLKMSIEEWNAATGPKLQGTWNLHEASLDQNLDFFLLFSSIGSMLGIPGQANYAAANTFMDAIVQFRHRSQLPASVIDVGTVQGIGHIVNNPQVLEQFKWLDCFRMSEKELYDAVTVAISRSLPSKEPGSDGYVNPSQFVTGFRDTVGLLGGSNARPIGFDNRLAFYFNKNTPGTQPTEKQTSVDKLKHFLSSAATNSAILSEPSAIEVVAKEIAVWVFDLLMKPVYDDSEVDLSRSLVDVGLDSLAAVEMRSWFKASMGLDISVLEIIAQPSLAAMGELVIHRLIQTLGVGKV